MWFEGWGRFFIYIFLLLFWGRGSGLYFCKGLGLRLKL